MYIERERRAITGSRVRIKTFEIGKDESASLTSLPVNRYRTSSLSSLMTIRDVTLLVFAVYLASNQILEF